MPQWRRVDLEAASQALGGAYFNLLRRGADGSLVLSADRWRVARLSAEAVHFEPLAPEAGALALARAEVLQVSWDRLPRQRVRSQVRFNLRSGDLWTFSGAVDEWRLPTTLRRSAGGPAPMFQFRP